MLFYKIPENLTEEQDQFESDIKDFKEGKINPVKFKAIRVAHGVYEQRTLDTYMIRIRCTTGGITPKQLRKVAELGRRYGSGEVHITTRQEVQIHDVLIDGIMPVIRELREVNLSSRGGGGNTIRNILTSPYSGINEEEVFDVEPYAIALSSKLIGESDSWNLPRKFKIAFSSNKDDTAFTQATCLGYVATIKDGQKGFKVYCSGGMGAKPMVGNLLFDFIDESKVYHVARAMKSFFDRYGNRKSKTTNRIKFLWKTLEREKFIEYFTEYYDKIKNDESLNLEIISIENSCLQSIDLEVETPKDDEKFKQWKQRFVKKQKQQDLFSIKIALRLGDLISEDAYLLCDLLEHFGDNTIRCDRGQNILLRNIPEAYLANFFNLICYEISTLSDLPSFIGNMINCTGAQTCKLGICLPRGLSDAIREKLKASSVYNDLDQLEDFRLNMSGCPNTCGMHHIAHLGFFGKVGRNKGNMYPAYNVLAGARVSEGQTKYAEKRGEIAAHYIPHFVNDFLQAYLLKKDDYNDYYQYLEEEGYDIIDTLCQKYKEVPTYEEDEAFYTDFGAKKRLSLDEIGTAECSAGMFDMIGVDRRLIKEKVRELDSVEEGSKRIEVLYTILLASARMLLVTRGQDSKTDVETFKFFAKHFIEVDLVDKKFLPLIELGIQKQEDQLLKNEAEIIELSKTVNSLYKNMDDSLRFNIEKVKAS